MKIRGPWGIAARAVAAFFVLATLAYPALWLWAVAVGLLGGWQH